MATVRNCTAVALRLWKNSLGGFTGRSPHGPSAALSLGVFTAKLTLLSATAMALAVKAAGHGFLLRVFTELGRIHGMIVIITALGDALRIFSAQLTLLATAALAAVIHAGLRIRLPSALQPFGAIKPTAGVLGVHFRLGINAHLRWLHPVPMSLGLTAAVDFLRVRTAELALLAAATLAGGLKAPLGALLPVACTELRPGQTHTWILRCLRLTHLQVRSHGGQDLFSTAGLDGLGVFSAQLALLTTTTPANGVHARRHACGNGLLVLSAQLTLLTPAAVALAFDAIVHSFSGTDRQQQAQEKSAGHRG